MAPFAPFPIAENEQGLFLARPPWKSPAQTWRDLDNAQIKDGILTVRKGRSQFSALETTETDTDTGDGGAGPYGGTFGNIPVLANTISLAEPVSGQTATDDGAGAFTGADVSSGTINYTTGVWAITWNAVVGVGDTITATASFERGLGVTGLLRFFPDGGTEVLLGTDTKRLFAYSTATNKFTSVTTTDSFTGSATDYFWGVNLGTFFAFTNGIDAPQKWDGTTLAALGVSSLLDSSQMVLKYKSRLMHINVVETSGATAFPRRVYYSDIFDFETITATNFIDIPGDGGGEIITAFIVQDRLVVVLERETWVLLHTGDPVQPFIFQRLSGSAGAGAKFGFVVKDDRAVWIGETTFHQTDGIQVIDAARAIPDFVIDMNLSLLQRSFGALLQEERQLLFGFATPTDTAMTRAAVFNYETDAWSVYTNQPFTVFGQFNREVALTWDELDTLAATGDELTDFFPDASTNQAGFPELLAGDANGDIWKLNDTNQDDGVNIAWSATTQRLNPFKGGQATLGWIDFIATRQPSRVLLVDLFVDFQSSAAFSASLDLGVTVDHALDGERVVVRTFPNLSARSFTIKLSGDEQNRPEILVTSPFMQQSGRRAQVAAL